MSVDPKFVELTADFFRIFLLNSYLMPTRHPRYPSYRLCFFTYSLRLCTYGVFLPTRPIQCQLPSVFFKLWSWSLTMVLSYTHTTHPIKITAGVLQEPQALTK